jgi:hypothetical protein
VVIILNKVNYQGYLVLSMSPLANTCERHDGLSLSLGSSTRQEQLDLLDAVASANILVFYRLCED